MLALCSRGSVFLAALGAFLLASRPAAAQARGSSQGTVTIEGTARPLGAVQVAIPRDGAGHSDRRSAGNVPDHQRS